METFLGLSYDRVHSTPDKFVEEVFWRSLFPEAQLLARCIWPIHPGFFRDDLELIRQAFNQTSLEDMESEIHAFRFAHPVRGWLRDRWRVRVSGRRILNLARSLSGRMV